MNNFLTTLKISLTALKAHKLRSFLTILGIVIGITSVILVFSAGEGLKGLLLSQMEAWGTDFVEVEIKAPATSKTSSENATNIMMGVNITTLVLDDAKAILDHPNVVDAYSGIMGQAIMTREDESDVIQIWGATSSFLNIDSSEIEFGRFYTEEEDKSLARVIVLGSEAKKKYFGNQEAIGKTVKIGRHNFKVIGVFKEKGTVMFMNLDEWIYMPIRPLQKLIMGIDNIMFVIGKLEDTDISEETAHELTLLMRDRHDISDPDKDDFAVTTMTEMMGIWDTILGGVTLLLMAIVAVSLIVGGVGIMNIMFVSVSERTNEIGLRKAVGASPGKILTQFLWEAIVLT
ncbi:hypothetical protein HOG50_01470, partial [bacterium]|nr:hypothetical protein [bacterium]